MKQTSEAGNVTFRTLFQYMKQQPEHSYLAVQQILKRTAESKDNLIDFCRTMNIVYEQGFMSIVPIPETLLSMQEIFKSALFDLKRIRKQYFVKNQYVCWVMVKEGNAIALKFLKQAEIQDNLHLLNPSTNFIGIYNLISSKPLNQVSKVPRNRFLSMKRNQSSTTQSKNIRSFSSFNPQGERRSLSLKKHSLSITQKTKSRSASAKDKAKPRLSKQNNYLSQTSFNTSNKTSSKISIPKKPKYLISYKTTISKI